jgi:hypothetical protein
VPLPFSDRVLMLCDVHRASVMLSHMRGLVAHG